MTNFTVRFRLFTALFMLFFLFANGIMAQQAKYVFYFIGDGMGFAHIATTEAYLAEINGENGFEKLNFNGFPAVGIATNHAETRLITGSAAAGTSLATGHKTTINTISMDGPRETRLTTIAEEAKKHGLKVGIISSVSINHATPAVFYAHQPLRSNYYEIGLDLINSGFNFLEVVASIRLKGKTTPRPRCMSLPVKKDSPLPAPPIVLKRSGPAMIA